MASHHVCQILLLISLLIAGVAGDFNKDFQITWGNGRAKILDGGQLLTLSLDRASGSGGQSRNQFLYGKFEVQLKLIPRNSAGTVTTYYLKSEGDQSWDEIDLEFLGNASGQPYTLHTNVFTKGKGNREQQFHLWFDPSQNFHTYSILWNSKRIILLVDGTPIREFKNMQSKGVLFPTSQPMRLYSTLWNADDWATQGGRVKTDWSLAPFTASYRNLVVNACNWSSGKSSCATATSGSSSSWMNEELNSAQQNKMSWAQKNYMVYNYCTDLKRFPQGLPKECL